MQVAPDAASQQPGHPSAGPFGDPLPPPPPHPWALRLWRNVAWGLVVLAAAGGAAWWWSRPDPQRELQAATEAMAKGDAERASIHLRTALGVWPEDAGLRVRLGQLALAVGDYPEAERQFRNAHSLGRDLDALAPMWAQALAESRKPSSDFNALDPDRLRDPRVKATVHAFRARALLREGKRADADAAIDAARRLAPDLPELGVTEVFRHGADGDLAAAARRLQEVLARHPQHLEAQVLRTLQLHDNGSLAEAIAQLRALVERAPAMPYLRSLLANWLLEQGDTAGAEAQVKALVRSPHGRFDALVLRARLLLRRGELEGAREAAGLAVKAAPAHPIALRVAADIELALGNLPVAETFLRSLLKESADDLGVRRTLAQVLQRQGKLDAALDTLGPVVFGANTDVPSILMAGRLAAQSGDARRAMYLYERAARQQPDAPGLAVGLAASKLLAGDTEGGIADLQAISHRQPGDGDAELLLLIAQLDAGRHEAARQTLQSLQSRQAKSPWLLNLRGAVLGAAGDAAAARAAFEEALALSAGHVPAILNLVQLDLREGRRDEAEQRLRQALAAQPQQVALLSTLAGLRRAANAPRAEVTELLERAHAAQPRLLPTRVELVHAYLEGQDTRKALDLAQKVAADFPHELDAVSALSQAHLAAGQPEQALMLMRKFVRDHRATAPALWSLMQVQLATGDAAGALDSARAARALDPRNVRARLTEAEVEVRVGEPRKARRLLQALMREQGESAPLLVLDGDLSAREKNPAAAAASYRRALAMAPSAPLAVQLHRALLSSGQTREAEALAQRWRREQPQDRTFRRHLADLQLAAGDLAGARSGYEALVAEGMQDPLLLNNLAWACFKASDPCATLHAEAALSRAPRNPAVLDTMGQIRLATGDAERAADLFAQALQVDPDDPQIALNHARALARAGRREEARGQLKAILDTRQPFEGSGQARSLLDSLR